jgi:hypothetical protein
MTDLDLMYLAEKFDDAVDHLVLGNGDLTRRLADAWTPRLSVMAIPVESDQIDPELLAGIMELKARLTPPEGSVHFFISEMKPDVAKVRVEELLSISHELDQALGAIRHEHPQRQSLGHSSSTD